MEYPRGIAHGIMFHHFHDGRHPQGQGSISAEEFDAILQQRVGDRGFVVPGPIFVPGVRVRFTEGPLAHLAGIIERRMSGPDRVRVLLELLHTNVSVEADVNLLERV